jgi:hypothetical protein
MSRLTATYLVTDGATGRRISVLAVHIPDFSSGVTGPAT